MSAPELPAVSHAQELQRLRAVLQACGVGVWLNPLPLGQLVWNDAVRAHFHLAPGTPVDIETFYARLHPDDLAATQAAIERSLASKELFDVVYRTVGPEGQVKWVRAVGHPLFGPDGTALQFDGVTLDLSEQMAAQAAVLASTQQMRAFADAAPAMLWATEPDGSCSFLSQGWYEFTGQTPATGLGLGWLDAVHAEERDQAQALFLNANARRASFALEHRVRRFDGQWHWVIDAGQPRFSPDGAFLGFVGSVTDIHQRRLAEEALRASQERYRAFVANSTEGIWRVEFQPPVDTRLSPAEQIKLIYRDGRFAECNDAFARMYGFERAQDMLGLGLAAMLPPDAPAARPYLEGLVHAGYRASEIESQEVDRWGNTLYFANSLTGVVEDGYLVRAWGTQRNVTDRRRAEQALLAADRRKDEFLALLAHELRNPLAPVRNALEILRRHPQASALGEPLDIMQRQVAHLTRLVDDLLEASRISRDQLRLRQRSVALAPLLRQAVETIQADLDRCAAALDLTLPDDTQLIEADPVRVVQIVANLLGNAVKYSAPGAPIALSATLDGGDWVIEVRDAGQGIAPHDLPHVFEMFYQGDRGLERVQGGLGIGLSLVQRLAQLHGGSAQAHSAGPGQGSVFTVRLPKGRVGPAPDPQGTPAPAATAPLHVLVVDDNRDAADTLADVLRLMGLRADTAYDGAEGVARAQALRPQAVVLDLGMPRMNGFEAAQRIRAQPWGQGLRLVAVSGWGESPDRERSRQVGFDAHLVKPVEPAELVAALAGADDARPPPLGHA